MTTRAIPLDRRPDIIDLTAADYDLVAEAPATKTLILCSAPRTGSYELCRFLMAAGIGIPHEYFHPQFAGDFGRRFGIEGNPLDGPNVQPYLDALRKNRAQNGVFAINLQYWQFTGALINGPGNALFDNATVIYLFRADVASQVTSWRIAMNTGIWDYSGRKTAEGRPFPDDLEERAQQYAKDAKFIVGEDRGFRLLFAMTGIDPYFITMAELFRDPADIVHQIAKRLETPVDDEALRAMIARSKPYPRDDAAYRRATEGLAPLLRRTAFGRG